MTIEHDERLFDVEDVLWLHERTGARVVFDLHHHRCNRAPLRRMPAIMLWWISRSARTRSPFCGSVPSTALLAA